LRSAEAFAFRTTKKDGLWRSRVPPRHLATNVSAFGVIDRRSGARLRGIPLAPLFFSA
jgi:hypothetical protein